MRRRLPIQIGKNLRKGLFAFRDIKLGGFNVCIVWLKKEYQSGEEYDISEIEEINAILHFCDKESVERTIEVLNRILKDWEKEACK